MKIFFKNLLSWNKTICGVPVIKEENVYNNIPLDNTEDIEPQEYILERIRRNKTSFNTKELCHKFNLFFLPSSSPLYGENKDVWNFLRNNDRIIPCTIFHNVNYDLVDIYMGRYNGKYQYIVPCLGRKIITQSTAKWVITVLIPAIITIVATLLVI
jgi:hypothetical protein